MSRVPLLSTLSHPRFYYPVLLFIAVVSLFLVIELRTEGNVRELRDSLGNKAPQLIHRLEESAQDFHIEIESYKPGASVPGEFETLKEKFQALRQRADELEKYYAQIPDKTLLYDDNYDSLRLLLDAIRQAENYLNAPGPLQDQAHEEIKQLALKASHYTASFFSAVLESHQKNAASFFSSLEREKKERLALFFLIFLGSSFLLGFMFSNVRREQRALKHTQAIEHYSTLFASALQSTQEGIIVINMRESEQPVTFVNKAFVRLTGYDPILMNEKKTDVLFGLHTDPDAVTAFQEAVRQGKPLTFELLIYKKSGLPFWSEWHINPVAGKDGKLAHYVFVFSDITDQKQIREAHRSSNELPKEDIKEEIKAQPKEQPREEPKEDIKEEPGQKIPVEIRVEPKEEIREELTLEPKASPKELPKEQTEEQPVAQPDRSRAIKADFLAALSREIDVPLDEVLDALGSLRETQLDQGQDRLLNAAMNTGASMREVLHDILDYAKTDAGKTEVKPEPFALREFIDQITGLVGPLAECKNLEIKTAELENLPERVIGDPVLIRQIILNLLTNAIKYTDQGVIGISVSRDTQKTGSAPQESLFRFEVIDSGIGIGEADQERLFEGFCRIENSPAHRFHGVGLGLAIARGLVTLMGGEIGVESKPGAGSKFWFVVPLKIEAEPEVIVPSDAPIVSTPVAPLLAPRQNPEEFRLLLLEDDKKNRLLVSTYLDQAGYKYDSADTSSEAFCFVKSQTYDLILMNISMPDMDGLEVARKLRAKDGGAATVPIIAMTSRIMPGDRERCLIAGMNDLLCRPLEYDTLLRTISSWLNTSMPSSELQAAANALVAAASEADMTVVQRMVTSIGIDAMRRVTQLSLDSIARQIEILKMCGARQELDVVERLAQSLQSNSADCGLSGFARFMSALEKAAGQGEEERAQAILQQLDAAYAAARQALFVVRDRYR
ncbi:MAG: ATP-binding protein [Alphaproteobacteria bacterium]|nr:ATP-binding protein [Alphaproteobacteria bacterium]